MHEAPRSVRRAWVGEVGALGALHLRTAIAAYGHIFPPEAPPPTIDQVTAQWQALFDDGAAVFVVEGGDGEADGDGGLIGEVAAVPSGYLARLYVDVTHWQRGIGGQLHDAAVEHLRSIGCRTARLWVLEANDRARAFYERRGWRPTGDRKPTYEPAGIDDIGYELAL